MKLSLLGVLLACGVAALVLRLARGQDSVSVSSGDASFEIVAPTGLEPVTGRVMFHVKSQAELARIEFLIDGRSRSVSTERVGPAGRTDRDHQYRLYKFGGSTGSWDTRREADGTHRLEVRARDTAGREFTAAKEVVVKKRIARRLPAGGLFSRRSVWKSRIPRRAELDPRSRTLVRSLAARTREEATDGWGPTIDTLAASTPVYKVGRGQPRVKVAGDPPAAWRGGAPIPPDAKPAPATDGTMAIWQPSTDTMWELFRGVRRRDGSWHATWGGKMEGVSRSRGYFVDRKFSDGSERQSHWWGGTASSLALAGGLITFDDLRAGRIDHALQLSVNEVRSKVYSLPAQRGDGKCPCPNALPEGARLRLDPRVDVKRLGLPRVTEMIALAAQRYGIVVNDISEVTGFSGEDTQPYGHNAYADYLGGDYPFLVPNLLRRFPWSRLQVLKLRLRPGPDNVGGKDLGPVVRLRAPERDGEVVRGRVRYRAFAYDINGVSRVEYYVDGRRRSVVRRRPFAFNRRGSTWDTTRERDGRHVLSVRAFDRYGRQGEATRIVQVKNR